MPPHAARPRWRWPSLPALSLAGVAAAAPLRTRGLRAPALAHSAGPSAAVFAREDQPPGEKGEASAELLRFVTAYRMGLEAIVDITPYAPLLESAADVAGDLRFFAFIDTWVGNSSGWDSLYMDNETGVCYPQRRSHGNGWSLSLDLVLQSPARAGGPVRPRASVVLGSGYFGGRYAAGVVELHPGKLRLAAGGESWLELESPADVLASDTPGALAAQPRVFRCERGRDEAERAALLGYTSSGFRNLVLRQEESGEDKEAERKDLRSTVMQTLVWPYMQEVKVVDVHEEELVVTGSYNTSAMLVRQGMPVYISPSDVLTDSRLEGDVWWNLTYPFEPAGEVISAANGTMTMKMRHPCLPSNATKQLPKLLVPAGPDVIPEAQALVDAAERHGTAAAGAAAPWASEEPLLLEPLEGWRRWNGAVDVGGAHSAEVREGPASLRPVPVLARVEGAFAPDAVDFEPLKRWGHVSLASAVNTTVCVVTQRRQGLLFQRQFELPALEPDDRVLLQLAVTGHGWAATTSGCGEFCHAVYRIFLNNVSVANVTQWRDDCHDNPIDGSMQKGTWFSSRNGWCPGSVEPGVFFDATQWMHAGSNELRVEVVVWSATAAGYVAYSDFGGFALGDEASFVAGLTAAVYGGEALGALRSRGVAATAAERALLEGCSRPEALRPPERVEWQRRVGGHERTAPAARLPQGTDAFDVEARAPWYFYNETTEGPLGAEDGASVVRIFESALVQANTRVIRAAVRKSLLAPGWSRAMLHLRLSQPPDGLEYDHWDRVGSIGLVLTPHGQDAEVHLLASSSRPSASWRLVGAPEAEG